MLLQLTMLSPHLFGIEVAHSHRMDLPSFHQFRHFFHLGFWRRKTKRLMDHIKTNSIAVKKTQAISNGLGNVACSAKQRHHFVATTTSSSFLPAAFKAIASDVSDTPAPYSSAVSNQLTPPSKPAFTVAFLFSCSIMGNAGPIKPPPPANSIIPKPMGVTSMPVFPSVRFAICTFEDIDQSLS